MNIAFCFSGFLRNLENIENIKHISSIFSSNVESLTIYYSCPTKIEENNTENFDKDYVLGLFKNQETNKIKVNISFRDYDKNVFVEKSKQLGLPYITSTNYHSYRVVSCINGQSETAKLINTSNKYNFIIFTRLDIINNITSICDIFDNNSILQNETYIWRTIPYVSSEYHAEDRFFICSNECVDIMKDAYNKIEQINIAEEHFGAEKIIGTIFNLYENIQKRHLYNLHVSSGFNKYAEQRIQFKYTQSFLESM
jgi:hypothetical protein